MEEDCTLHDGQIRPKLPVENVHSIWAGDSLLTRSYVAGKKKQTR